MHEFCRMQRQIAGATMKQIKLMANISLADPFHPSESRLQMPASIPGYEVRVTTAPVANGEAIALRLINSDKLNLPLHELGLSPQSFATVHRMLHQRSGLMLIAGPTGAGKTTTAYSIIHVLFNEHQKIISIEDPVELVVPYIRQINVDERHEFSMRSALSTILRMDPDAVFVGEIRDREAAHVAIQAASCGKRAFSTMHMRDISATVSAMREFDIDPKTLADNLSGVIAQRLVRRICPKCCQRSPLTRHEIEMFTAQHIEPPAELARPRGCAECRGTGYHGRIGIFEAVVVEGDIAQAIREQVHETELRRLVRASGVGLVADGLVKARDGITTIEELQETSWLVDSLNEPAAAPPPAETYQRAMPGSRAGVKL
jgi:general secretion pathway protein E